MILCSHDLFPLGVRFPRSHVSKILCSHHHHMLWRCYLAKILCSNSPKFLKCDPLPWFYVPMMLFSPKPDLPIVPSNLSKGTGYQDLILQRSCVLKSLCFQDPIYPVICSLDPMFPRFYFPKLLYSGLGFQRFYCLKSLFPRWFLWSHVLIRLINCPKSALFGLCVPRTWTSAQTLDHGTLCQVPGMCCRNLGNIGPWMHVKGRGDLLSVHLLVCPFCQNHAAFRSCRRFPCFLHKMDEVSGCQSSHFWSMSWSIDLWK